MSKKINLSIPAPCHESWEAMSPTDKGRFCASCQKNVVDFTKASDRQIAAALRESDSVCGRFNQSQLERELIIPKEKNKLWVAASAAVVTLLTIGNNQVFAQSPVNTEQTENKTGNVKSSSTEAAGIIKGTVLDEAGIPFPGVNVRLKNSDKGSQTDFDGIFSIEAKKGDVLLFEYPTYITQEISVKGSEDIHVVLKEDPATLQEVTILGYMTHKKSITMGTVTTIPASSITQKRTFMGRVLHSIGNIFH